ncbi:hypothetical protein [Saccharibacillus sacchari]|uniref:Uncharacterized protein n=1 Tax=Saccharibacillus sacchari TaxID=456493 RepID=A0ACC6PEV1_9BACL
MSRFDWDNEHTSSNRRSVSRHEEDRQNPYRAERGYEDPVYPNRGYDERGYGEQYYGAGQRDPFAPYGRPAQRPYRYGMALAGFILGAFSLAMPILLLILMISTGDSDGYAALGGLMLLSIPVCFVGSIVGLTLSIVAVRSSRGAKFAIAGICFNALGLPLSGFLSLLVFVVLVSS